MRSPVPDPSADPGIDTDDDPHELNPEDPESLRKWRETEEKKFVQRRMDLINRAYVTMGLMGAAILLLFVLVFTLKADINNGRAETITNREAGYKNRAISCMVLQNTGSPLPEACLDPKVQQYMVAPTD